MDFGQVIASVCQRLDRQGVRYALIGGFAMALRGVQRATHDLDLILMLDDLGVAHEILTGAGYRRAFHSENVSHYTGGGPLGRIDLLHAFRTPSLGMLERAERLDVDQHLSVPVVTLEDIVGLKLQALTNDPSRKLGDWHDISLLLEFAGARGQSIDWELISDYLQLFRLGDKLPELRYIHESAH